MIRHFFLRNAENLDHAPMVVLIRTQKEPLQLPPACGYCDFVNCNALLNTGDLGIAVGSAVSLAANLHVDNRIMYTAGKAAIKLGILGNEVLIAYAIPLSAKGKTPSFDRS